MKKIFAGAFAGVLCFALFPAGWAQMVTIREMGPELHVQVRMDTTGEATLGAWSSTGGIDLVSLLPAALHCQEGLKTDENGGNAIRCRRALRRDGLALEAVLDLEPIARKLNGSTAIELWVNAPRLGFASSSIPMAEEVDGPRVTRTTRFAEGVAPGPIRIRFGFQPGQLAGVYLPLLALALALTLISTIMSRAGFAGLALSAILLGTMVWMCAASQLEAAAPLRILLFDTPLANYAALFVDLWPPLFCVALGVSIGSRMRGGRVRTGRFGEVFLGYAVIPLILTCVVGALPSINRGDWIAVAGWISAAPVFLLVRRAWNRARTGARVRLLMAGEMKERISALAARVGYPQVKVYISFSTRSPVANALMLRGKVILLTAPLVGLLSKREMDSVAAHELSHVRQSNHGAWMALCIAMLLCETPVREFAYLMPGGLVAFMILPLAIFFASLHGARKREFAADASAAALIGDPRGMISSLARIARYNYQPLDLNAMAECFSSHPSTRRRIRALAIAARLGKAEVENLCDKDDPVEHYEIPAEEHGGELFTPGWQKNNTGIHVWSVIFGSCGAGLPVAWFLYRFSAFEVAQAVAGIVLGCLLTKGLVSAVMAFSYTRLRRKLAEKLGVGGQLLGFAPDGEARIYGNSRFCDAGLLRFANGRLCYQSERMTIALNPADVVEVGMVAAAPSNWFRRQPMVRFRNPESGESHAFILHTLDWLATQRRLLRSIQRWRATQNSLESTSVSGFNPVASQPFRNPTISGVARGFIVPGGIALVVSIVTCLTLRTGWIYVAWTLAVTACAYTSMLLPAMLYRPQSHPPEPPSQANTN
ncbi:MAG: M48 family metallopeptidase [Terracidiphilus sp.]